ncbi:MAG TPA: tyrosine--tRNA ligase, partial [Candidatus Nanoarchaeia archaeon]|nr:tyrosine--tRNA ligase [Candidatus Nanoarchaeia archaeon]
MDRLELIRRNTAEIIQEDELKDLLNKKKNPIVYWGTAPTGKIHIGYYIPMMKLGDFLKAGFKVKILIADLHAYLDDQKTLWNQLEVRSEYYKLAI